MFPLTIFIFLKVFLYLRGRALHTIEFEILNIVGIGIVVYVSLCMSVKI